MGHRWEFGRSVFGRDDRVWGCYQKRGTAVNHLVGDAWLQRSRSLTRASVSAGTNPVENNACKLLWVRTGARDSGRHLEREGVWKGDAFGEGRGNCFGRLPW